MNQANTRLMSRVSKRDPSVLLDFTRQCAWQARELQEVLTWMLSLSLFGERERIQEHMLAT